MKYVNHAICLVLTLGCFPFVVTAESSIGSWNLPASLNDKNAEVYFEVDSTWHMVKGTTANVSGEISLEKDADPRSVKVDLRIPISSFDTDNSMRDEELREVMQAKKYPELHFQSAGLLQSCTPAKVLRDGSCSDVLEGTLTLLKTKKKVTLPIVISMDTEKRFLIEGKMTLRWLDYGIEDPSIFVARVEPIATIYYKVRL